MMTVQKRGKTYNKKYRPIEDTHNQPINGQDLGPSSEAFCKYRMHCTVRELYVLLYNYRINV